MGNLSYDMLFCLLILYAFVSWAVEVVFFALWDRRFVNRGFLNLPLNLHCGLAAAILAAALPTLEHNLLMQYLLGVNLGWFPVQGGYAGNLLPSAGMVYYVSLFRHWQLPFLTTVILMIGGQAIGMRSMSLYELNVDYVLYSKLLGIRDRKITLYVFKNAVLPQITGLALSLGTMVGGALITEMIFSYPGIGLQLQKAVRNVDYTLISGCTLVISMTVLVANFLVDIVYGLIDPRVRAAQSEEG